MSTSSPAIQPIRWSYSSLGTFENCPKRFYHEKIAGDFKSEGSDATRYGTLVHEAAEAYLKHGTPLPLEFSYMKDVCDALKAMPGELHSELDISLKFDYTPCEAEDPEAWLRGYADIVIVNGERGLVADFKTGKSRYAKIDQLEIYALAAFRRFPQLKKVTGMLLFVREPGAPLKKTFSVEEAPNLWLAWIARVDKIRQAREFNNWPAKTSGLCRFCPVTSCSEHPTWKPY